MEKTVTQNNPDRRDRKNPDRLTEGDFAADKMGNNDLQGNDQQEVRNERHALPGEKREAEGLIEQDAGWITVTPRGRLLIRSICMVFDRHLRADAERRRYSKVI